METGMSQLFDDKMLELHMKNAARKEGYNAYCDGKKVGDNPYNTDEEWQFHEAWKDGWYNAAQDD